MRYAADWIGIGLASLLARHAITGATFNLGRCATIPTDQSPWHADKSSRRKARWLKTFLEETIAFLLLVVLSPLLGGIALWLFAAMGRPLLFRQTRSGLAGRPFRIIKFRTMTDEQDSAGRMLPDEKRLTAVGRFLRATSLDELPELWNVLRRELSLVGPRPLLPQYLERYSPEQARRHEVTPGITGWAQINGRNDLPWKEKFALDVWYVDNWSLGLDLRILWKTFWQVLKREGISRCGHATAPEFIGSPLDNQNRQRSVNER